LAIYYPPGVFLLPLGVFSPTGFFLNPLHYNPQKIIT
jgi:hypothetical protein